MKVWTVRYVGQQAIIGIFDSEEKAKNVKRKIEERWAFYMGCEIGVYIDEYEVQ